MTERTQPRTWMLGTEESAWGPVAHVLAAPFIEASKSFERVEVVELEPMLDLLERLVIRPGEGLTWTPANRQGAADDAAAILRQHGRLP
jgi:hypothetical protein